MIETYQVAQLWSRGCTSNDKSSAKSSYINHLTCMHPQFWIYPIILVSSLWLYNVIYIYSPYMTTMTLANALPSGRPKASCTADGFRSKALPWVSCTKRFVEWKTFRSGTIHCPCSIAWSKHFWDINECLLVSKLALVIFICNWNLKTDPYLSDWRSFWNWNNA